VVSAVRLLLTFALRSTFGALAQGTPVDRDDIAGLDAAHDDRPGYRTRRWPWQAGVNAVGTALISPTSSTAPRTTTVNSSLEATVTVGVNGH
jgi:hypothetical protein